MSQTTTPPETALLRTAAETAANAAKLALLAALLVPGGESLAENLEQLQNELIRLLQLVQ